MDRFKPVKGKPLTFMAPGLVRGGAGTAAIFIQFFRLHDARYMVYWPVSTPAGLQQSRRMAGEQEAARLALDARTVDQVAPGEQQPEADHAFKDERGNAVFKSGRHWRDASLWFNYTLNDSKGEGAVLRSTLVRVDAGRQFDVLVEGHVVDSLTLAGDVPDAFYDVDIPLAPAVGPRVVTFRAAPESKAGGLYGLRMLRVQ